jgi:hypothetical protein
LRNRSTGKRRRYRPGKVSLIETDRQQPTPLLYIPAYLSFPRTQKTQE